MKEESIVRLFRAHPNRSYSFGDLLHILKIDKSAHRQFQKLLRKLVSDGAISTYRHKYCLPREWDKLEGVVSKHRKGFAFVSSGVPGEEDVFLNQREARALMDGDRVLIITREGRRGKREGSVFRILERGKKRIVGTFGRFEKH